MANCSGCGGSCESCGGCAKALVLTPGEVVLLQKLAQIAPEKLMARYKLAHLEEDGFRVLEAICKARGFIQKGGVYDTDRAVRTVLDEFRGGKIGQISLESPEE